MSKASQALRRGAQVGNAGHPAAGARLVRAGLATLGWQEDGWLDDTEDVAEQHRALAARMVITLAYLEAEQGRGDYGLRLLERAEASVAAADRGHLYSQRGLILLRRGRWADALVQLTAAEPLASRDPELLARVLLNRGVLHLNTGSVQPARSDLRRSVSTATAAGLTLLAAKATQNLGYCDLLGGDIPSALHQFDAAAQAYREAAPGILPSLETDRARALLAAGLADEAAAALDASIIAFRRQRRTQLLAEAQLARAQAAEAAGDLTATRRWATLAKRVFQARGNHAWAALAELTRLRAAFAVAKQTGARQTGGRRYGQIAEQARQTAERLRAHGLPRDAAQAELLAARALIAARRLADAARSLAATPNRGLPLDTTLLRRLARAELAAADGRDNAALAELRSGLSALHTRRALLGSLELQTGAAALGTELASLGLRIVLARGAPRHVFSWLEQSRAQSFRVSPVWPPADPDAAAALAELRQLELLIRTAELRGDHPDPALVSRRTELQRDLRQRTWRVSGLGEVTGVAGAEEVAALLADSGQALISIAVHNNRMLAVTIADGRIRLTPLGDPAVAGEAARRLAADLNALAGRNLPPRLEAVIRESLRRQTEVLDREVLAPLRSLLEPGQSREPGGLVIVPAGDLFAVPWGMLPSLRGRPVMVCPSASAWVASRHAASAGVSGQTTSAAAPLLVAGPGLAHAVPEVDHIATVYPGSRPLTGEVATVDATLRALDGAALAHLAAHGHHDRENVLFSRLDLADGPLMAYDIQRLSVPPRQVVLSACDTGRIVVRPGDEILGFTAALLHIGTPTVISSVTRVADDVASGIMTEYHTALSKGAGPAQALATAAGRGPDDTPVTPFVCFGAG
jgi:hypothetical protein